MNTATITQIKPVENNLEILNQFAIELDLDTILSEELAAELPNDISNGF